MAENSQLSGNTKNSSTGTSSTDTSSETIGKHENEIVPHKISNHDKLVQTMVMVDGEWINVNDTNDQANMKDDMNKVNKKVVEAQKGIVEAKSAADSAAKTADSAVSASVVNSDAITAQSAAISEAKSAISSATAAIQQTAATAASDAAKIRADVAQVQNEVDTAKAANSATVEALKSDVSAAKQDIQAARQANENVAKQLDDYTKQAQAQGKTIKDIQNAQDGYTATLADVKGNVSKISDAVDGLSASLKDDQDNVATIKAKADELSATLTDHDKNIAQLTASAKELSSTLEDADGRISKVEQTASTLTNEFSDQDGRLSKVEQTTTGTQQTVANQQGQINSIQTDAAGIHETITGQGNQIANINVTLNELNSKYDGVSGDLSKLSDKVTTNSTQIDQNKKSIALKADQSTVSNLTGEVSHNAAQLKVQADQISSKVSSTDFKTLNDKVDGMKIGGRNMVAGTAEPYTMGYGIPNTTWQNGYAYESLPTKILTDEILPQNDQFFANLVPGQEYTQTIWFETDADVKKLNAAITWFTNVGHDEQPAKIIKVGENSYKLFSTYTWPGKTDNNVRLFDIFYLQDAFDLSTGTYIKFGKLKLEEGNVSTDWTPAPEDTIAAIQKNTTAIDQTNQQISLKADQTEVDQIKQTATQNSSRLNVMAGEISSKVTSTDVNNIVNGKGYATTSTVQSLVDQKAGTINESITNLEQTVKQGAENNVQLVRKSEFEDGSKGSWNAQMIVSATNPAPPAELGQSGMKVLQSNTRDAYEVDVWYSVKPGEKFDVDFWCAPSNVYNSNFGLTFVDKNKGNTNWLGIVTDHSGAWKHYTGTITAPTNAAFARPWFQIDKDSSNTSNTAWLAKPSIRRQNATTVAAIQQITASIDGIQSTVANKADKSQITQLSNVIQSKVSTSDFTSKVSQLSNDINARVAKGDLLSQINVEAGRTLIQSNKIYFDADSFVMSPNSKAFIPSAFITDLSADKITSGTLDAGNIRVINLTADNIHGGTLDVGDMHVKNFSANDIVAGTLTGIDILSKGENGKKYEMVGSQLKWSDDNKHYASIGQNDFHNNYVVNPAAFSLLSNSSIFLGRVPFDDKGEPKTSFLGLDNSSIWINDKGTQIASDGFHVLSVGEDQRYYDITKGEEWNTASFEIDTIGAIQFNLNPDGKSLDAGTGKQSLDWNSNSQLNIQKDNHFGAYFGQGNNGNQINFAFGGDGCGFNVNGPLHVTGSKNSIVETRQGYLAINAYETAEYYFGDIGENNTGDTSQVVIGIDRIFNEVVNTDIQYQVFVTPYSNAHVWVEKRYNNRFIVKSDRPNAEFGWELKAKRKGYEDHRLRRIDVDFNQMDLKGEN